MIELLNIERGIVSIVGGGGKTTIMKILAEEYAKAGKSVLVTTTTAMESLTNIDYIVEGKKHIPSEKGKITWLFKHKIQKKKVKGFEGEEMENILSSCSFDLILCEADGAKKKPIKAPRHGEPVLLEHSTHIIGVIGMTALNQTLSEDICHRVPYMNRLTNERHISQQLIIDLICHPNGLFKDAGNRQKILILNQCDTSYLITQAEKIYEQVKNKVNIGIAMSFQKKQYKKLTS